MKLAITLFCATILTGCATEMIGQCAMKSVSNDPLYGVGCGLAVTASVVEGGAMMLNTVIDKTKPQFTPIADETATKQSAAENGQHQ